MKGVNKFRIDPEHLRKMLERQKEAMGQWSEFIDSGGIAEVPGLQIIHNNHQNHIRPAFGNIDKVKDALDKYLKPCLIEPI